jgi:hypothetical protein
MDIDEMKKMQNGSLHLAIFGVVGLVHYSGQPLALDYRGAKWGSV